MPTKSSPHDDRPTQQMAEFRNRVIGIDPGYDRLGVAVVEGGNLIFSTCIRTDRQSSHAERLKQIADEILEVIAKWQPEALAIEKLFFNQNTTNALKVAEARGVVLQEAAQAGMPVFEYSPQEIKIAVTGYGQADKRSVEVMVRKLIRLPSRKMLDDELDAIAVGITHLASRKPI